MKKILCLFFLVIFFSTFNLLAVFAAPTGTGGEEFPLGSDAGDDFNVDSGELTIEGDTGNVGLSSTNPRSKLDVSGTATATAFSGDGSVLTSLPSGGWTDGGTNVYITVTTDNVGVGTTQPTGRLDIRGGETRIWTGAGSANNALSSGDIYIQGDFEADGTIYGNGVGLLIALNANGWTDGGTNVYNTPTTDNVGIGTSQGIGRLNVRGDEMRVWTGAGSDDIALSSGELYVEGDFETDGSARFEKDVTFGDENYDSVLEIKGQYKQVSSAHPINQSYYTYSNTPSDGSRISFYRFLGTELSPDPIILDDGIGLLDFWGYDGSVTARMAQIAGTAETAATGGIMPSNFKFATASLITGTTTKMIIEPNGNVGIGSYVLHPAAALDIRIDEVRSWTGAGSNNRALSGGEFYVEGDMESDGTIYGDGGGITGAGGGGWNDGGTNVYVTTSADNIGIGTTQPTGDLDVRGDEVRIWTGAGSSNNALSSGELYVQGDLEVDTSIFFDSNVGIGTLNPALSLNVNGGFALTNSGTIVNITADDTLITVGNRTYFRLTSNNTTDTNRTFCLTEGNQIGQIVILEWTHASDEGRLNDGLETCSDNVITELTTAWPTTTNEINNTLILIWNGADWIEIGRGTN